MAVMSRVHRTLFIFSLSCYGLALFLPGLAARESNPYGFHGVSGFMCLVFGWSTVVAGWKYFLPWMSNFLYLPALLLWIAGPRARRWGALLALGSLILAAQTLRIDTFMVNEAGHRVAVQPGLGAWCWMASMIVLLFGAVAPIANRSSP